jgi:hypothetical protein
MPSVFSRSSLFDSRHSHGAIAITKTFFELPRQGRCEKEKFRYGVNRGNPGITTIMPPAGSNKL